MRYFQIEFLWSDGFVFFRLWQEKIQTDIVFNSTQNARCSPITIKARDITESVPLFSFVKIRLYDPKQNIDGQEVYRWVLWRVKKTHTNTKDERYTEYEYEILHIWYLLERCIVTNNATNTILIVNNIVNGLNNIYWDFFSVGTVSDNPSILPAWSWQPKEIMDRLVSYTDYVFFVWPTWDVNFIDTNVVWQEKIINEWTQVSQIIEDEDFFYVNNEIQFTIEYLAEKPEPPEPLPPDYVEPPDVYILKQYTKTDGTSLLLRSSEILWQIGRVNSETAADELAESYATQYFQKNKEDIQQVQIILHPSYNIYNLKIWDTISLHNSHLWIKWVKITDINYDPTGGDISIGKVVKAEQALLWI